MSIASEYIIEKFVIAAVTVRNLSACQNACLVAEIKQFLSSQLKFWSQQTKTTSMRFIFCLCLYVLFCLRVGEPRRKESEWNVWCGLEMWLLPRYLPCLFLVLIWENFASSPFKKVLKGALNSSVELDFILQDLPPLKGEGLELAYLKAAGSCNMNYLQVCIKRLARPLGS